MASPVLSAILSFIIPGLGQAINGEGMRGVILFIAAALMFIIAMFIFQNWIAYIIDFIIAVYAAFDAYVTASN